VLAGQMLDAAKRSELAVRSMVHTMATIRESAQRIQPFSTVIEGVAFQTNIPSRMLRWSRSWPVRRNRWSSKSTK
jgi:hypothetical protein